MPHPRENDVCAFWIDFKKYLMGFYAATGDSGDFETLEGCSLWSRQSEGTLYLTSEENDLYQQFLRRSQALFSPDDDLSARSLDSAIKDAIFHVVDIRDQRTESVECRVREALTGFKTFIDATGKCFDCWIEVSGLDISTLPATFGNTTFTVLSDQDIRDNTRLLAHRRKTEGDSDFDFVEYLTAETSGRPIAIQSVTARDAEAALSLATREVSITVECLNFFAEIIPYNRARIRLPIGHPASGSSVQFTLADDGTGSYRPQAIPPWTFSFDRLSELQGILGQAAERVNQLRCQDSRNEVEELLIRAVRWAGRAVETVTPEDKVLYSMIALECAVLPKRVRSIRRTLACRTARLLAPQNQLKLAQEIKSLYDIRSKLVHDGSFEVTEDDVSYMKSIALQTIVKMLTLKNIANLAKLSDLHIFLDSIKGDMQQA